MQISPLPREKLVTDDGYMHPQWVNYFSRLHQLLGLTVNKDGHVIPSQPTTTINKIPLSKKGNLVYDSTTNTLKANINGAIHTVTTAP